MGTLWECGPHARWEPNVGPKFPQHSIQRPLKAQKKIGTILTTLILFMKEEMQLLHHKVPQMSIKVLLSL